MCHGRDAWHCRFTRRRLYKLTKYFSGQSGGEVRSGPLAVAEEGRGKVAAFQENLPLITAICNPGLRERHWQVRVCVCLCVCVMLHMGTSQLSTATHHPQLHCAQLPH